MASYGHILWKIKNVSNHQPGIAISEWKKWMSLGETNFGNMLIDAGWIPIQLGPGNWQL